MALALHHRPHLLMIALAVGVLTLTEATRLSHPTAEIIDRIMAVVEEDTITLSELGLYLRWQGILTGRQAQDPAGQRQVLERMIERRLILRDAKRLKLVEVTDQDVEVARDALRGRLGGQEGLQQRLTQYRLTLDQTRSLLQEELLASRHLQRRLQFQLYISEGEISAYLADHPQQVAGRPVAEAREQAQQLLQEQKRTAEEQRWLKEQWDKANIRINP